jgi:sugar (pentulose or hexulose) kinase
MLNDLVLAIDLGSSWCKAAYLDREGRLVASGRSYTREIQPARRQMLEIFWAAVSAAVQAANRDMNNTVQPAAIGISCRGMFGVAIDETGRASWPAWDYGSTKTSPEVRYAYSPEVWGERDPYAYGYAVRLAALLRRLKAERPHDWERIQRVGALHDYIVYRMTGEWVTDPTTGPGQNDWPQEILEMAGLPRRAFPCLLEPQAIAGGLLAEAADELGVPAGTPVVVGLHDGAAANLGLRAVQAGDACFTLGTNFVLRAVTGLRLTSRCFCYLVAPGSWAWVNNVPTAAPQLDLVAHSLREELAGVGERHLELGRLADEVDPGAQGLVLQRVVLPGQAEELRRSISMAQQAGRTEGVIYRAMLEAIAFGLLALVDRARQDGATPQRFIATGGAAHNRSFVKVLAAVLDRPVEVGFPEAGIIGAGIAAAMGAGWFTNIEGAMAAMTTPGPLIQPAADAAAYYRDLANQREFDRGSA